MKNSCVSGRLCVCKFLLFCLIISSALYMEQSVESLSKPDHLSSYCASPKLDYCSQYDLKLDISGEDTDPDIIPCQYGKIIITLSFVQHFQTVSQHDFIIIYLCFNGSSPYLFSSPSSVLPICRPSSFYLHYFFSLHFSSIRQHLSRTLLQTVVGNGSHYSAIKKLCFLHIFFYNDGLLLYYY